MFNIITGINESKTLATHVSRECKFKFDEKNPVQINGGINDKYACECKKRHVWEEDCIWDIASCSCDNGKYLADIVDNSVITCDEITEEETKTVMTNFNEKNEICKTKILYILLDFLSITVALLIAVKVYYYQIKYKAK